MNNTWQVENNKLLNYLSPWKKHEFKVPSVPYPNFGLYGAHVGAEYSTITTIVVHSSDNV